MVIWGENLEVNVVLAEGLLHFTVALVVEDVENGGCAVLLEVFMERLPRFIDL